MPHAQGGVDHYRLSVIDGTTGSTSVVQVVATESEHRLTGLKAATSYQASILACLDTACASYRTGNAPASATTEVEYWQLQGSKTTDSFSAMSTIAADSNSKAWVFRYGSSAEASLAGKARIYFDGRSTPGSQTKIGVNVALTTSAVSDVASASALTLAPGYGLLPPPSATTYIGASQGENITTSQAIPLAKSATVRMYFAANGADGMSRMLQLDSHDGYTGADFHSGSSTQCSSVSDYTTSGCVPQVVMGVHTDSIAPSALTAVRQSKVGYPTMDSWLWDESVGSFMVITGSAQTSCNLGTQLLAYATYDGSKWVLDTDANTGCPKSLATNGHGPVIVHLGQSRYKMYYEDGSKGNNDKPLRVLYADGSASGQSTLVESTDWEPSSKARQVHFLWPSGAALSASNESGLGDHVIYMPTNDPSFQVMYMNLGGMDDPTWAKPSAGIGIAVLLNP